MTDIKSLNTKYGLCPLFLFDNSNVTLLFSVKRQHFRRISYFLGTDVIFLHVYEHCCSTRLFFFLQKRTDVKSLNTKYGLCLLFLFGNSDVTLLFRVKTSTF